MLLMNSRECQGLLLTARDLVFGVIDFGLYYALLTRLRLSCFGAGDRDRTGTSTMLTGF